MNISILLGVSCPFAGLCNSDYGRGILTGVLALLIIVLLFGIIKKIIKKGSLADSKELDTSKAKIAELAKFLSDEKEKALKSFEDGALYTLVLLQREGRFVDFIKEDIKNYEDAQIGAAVRQIHSGCAKIVNENFKLKALYDTKKEGEKITVSENFNAEEIRLSGNVPPNGPYKGILRHKGWTSQGVNLPKKIGKSNSLVVCPAEVEIE